MVSDRTPDDGMQPDVIGHADCVEPGLLGSLDDLAQQRPEARGASLPSGLGDVQSELHDPGLKTMSHKATSSTVSTTP